MFLIYENFSPKRGYFGESLEIRLSVIFLAKEQGSHFINFSLEVIYGGHLCTQLGSIKQEGFVWKYPEMKFHFCVSWICVPGLPWPVWDGTMGGQCEALKHFLSLVFAMDAEIVNRPCAKSVSPFIALCPSDKLPPAPTYPYGCNHRVIPRDLFVRNSKSHMLRLVWI